MSLSKVKAAYELCNKKEYEKALHIYNDLSKSIGYDFFKENIDYCKKRIKINNLKYKKIKNSISTDDIEISVIIPTYNSENFIKRAIDSILAQIKVNYEIIIFDDYSSDNTLEIVHRYKKNNNNITIIESEKNVGQGKGRNEALKFARGDYILFLDSDDYFIDKNFFFTLLDIAKKLNIDIIFTPYMRENCGKFKYDNFPETSLITNKKEFIEKFLSRDLGTHGPCAKLFKASIAKNSYFSEYGYSQDVIFVLKALVKSKRIYLLKKYSYVYYQDNNSSWRPQQLTPLHFYSSLRLFIDILLEIYILKIDNITIDYEKFLVLWKKDHGKRIEKFLNENKYDIKFLINYFKDINPILIYVLGINNIYSKFINMNFQNYDNKINFSISYLEHAQRKISNIKTCITIFSNKLNTQKEIIIIYISYLSNGGLERVAVHLGNVLSNRYNVIYLLDNPSKIEYKHSGIVLKADLTNLEILSYIEKSSFIFDFKYKKTNFEFPICKYFVDNYYYKYIPTIHNTKTCKDYFEKIKEYLNGLSINNLFSILCVSKAVKHEFVKLYGYKENIKVIYNPIDLKNIEKEKAIKHDKDYILFSGRLNATEHKGIDILIKSYFKSDIKEKVDLVLAGSGELDAELQNFINNNHISKYIKIVGFKDNIYSYIKGALFTVAPSRWEGFSMTIIESLACGVPVLTTDVGKEIIKNKINGYIIPKNDISRTAEGINFMYNNYESMKPYCVESVKELDLNKYGEKIIDLLNNNLY